MNGVVDATGLVGGGLGAGLHAQVQRARCLGMRCWVDVLHVVAASCDTTDVVRVVGHCVGAAVRVGVKLGHRGPCRFLCCQRYQRGSGITGAWVKDQGLCARQEQTVHAARLG